MSEPFLAEVRIVGFNFPPRGYAFCDGQVLPINQNQSLYSLLGTTYGGDGETSFALPELRGRVPVHVGPGKPLGQKSGQERVSLTVPQMGAHSHGLLAYSEDAEESEPTDLRLARTETNAYVAPGAGTAEAMRAGSILPMGSGQGHENMQPSLAISFCIALQGLFPSEN